MRRLPPDVKTSIEVKAALIGTRCVYAELRWRSTDRPIFCAENETPAQALATLATGEEVPITGADAETIYRDGLRCELWHLEDGILVIPALPPSVHEERSKPTGARGGKSPAQKQRDYRARLAAKKAEEERTAKRVSSPSPLPPAQSAHPPGSGEAGVPPMQGVSEGGAPPSSTASGSRASESLPLFDKISTETERGPDPERAGATPSPDETEGGEGASPDESMLKGAALAAAVVEALRAAGPSWSPHTNRHELEALGVIFDELKPRLTLAEVRDEWVPWLREDPTFRETFRWLNNGAGIGPADPLTPNNLLAPFDKVKRVWLGSAVNSLRASAGPWAAKRAKKPKLREVSPSREVQRLAQELPSPDAPGTVRAGAEIGKGLWKNLPAASATKGANDA